MLRIGIVVIRFPTVQQSELFVTQSSKEVLVLHLSIMSSYN